MGTNIERQIDGEAFVLPAAIIAGATFCAADSEVCSRICNAATGETIGWQEHATAEMVDRAVLAWNDGTVRRIAWGIYEQRAFGRLPILHDALLDAGCDDEALLEHLRGEGPHVRGCWALDTLLGRP